jgi:NAD(P)H-hydrate epimerase
MEITVKQMMQIEENGHQMGFLRKFMMENAGAAAVRRLEENYGDVSSKRILIFAGLGNNGGDAFVIARHIAGRGANVTVVLLGSSDKIKTEESQWNWKLLEKMVSIKLISEENFSGKYEGDIIVDGILGTGITGSIREPYASAMNFINNSKSYKLAVDVPSGLDPDTGNTSNIFVTADMTVTFHKMKIGMPKRKDLCGKIFVEKIGIPPEAEAGVL